ncbi:recombinase family protein [Helicobacter canis]|uniref:Resolvase/invertase-type recombinase catalytic domain-containing protein n=1 Tax=Helicobacter canis NCTC 12740 TaxID=1357399 RepID=V8CE50_9HELI|nr:recombinase family protein [Helicobacter canis]ETD25629.1 hypothetical protein HMPREF2087_01457 [Helicobacter canis NCTC 12740]
MTYAYLRVSTDRQNLENQEYEVKKYAEYKGITIDKFVQEKMSGKIAIDHRELGQLKKKLKVGDTLIVPELSRLGRSMLDVLDFINYAIKKKILLISLKEKFELGDNIQSKVVAFAFSLSAEIERQLISQRTKEALARLKAEGVHIGRPRGRRNIIFNEVCVKNHDKIVDTYNAKGSLPQLASEIGVARGTLYRYMYYTGIREPHHALRSNKTAHGIKRLERGIY